MKIKVKYFAALREQANKSEELIEGDFEKAQDLYNFIQDKYHFSINQDFLKVAINEEYKEFTSDVHDGDIVVFIPPVAGG